MPYIIAFVSQKGGVGKSTLARATALELQKNNLQVKFADLDVQQASSVEWHRRRLENSLEPVGSVETHRTLAQALERAASFDAIVIDGAGRSSEATYHIAERADLVVQPSNGTYDDMDPAIRVFHELTKKNVARNKLFFALSRLSTPAEEKSAREYLEQTGYFVLNGAILDKSGYKNAQNEGKAITETAFPTLNERADALIQAIFNQLTGEEETHGATQESPSPAHGYPQHAQ